MIQEASTLSLFIVFGFGFLLACAAQEKGSLRLTVTSTAFAEGESIPAEYTCLGQDTSPPLQWSGIPATAASLALIVDDPDAPGGTWVHWVYYNLPPTVTGLPAKVDKVKNPPPGGVQGITDFRKIGYGGPCPPRGRHRYYFKLYALDGMLPLQPGATKQQLLKAMEGRILAQGSLMGTFAR